ncbi:phenylalanine--tRNA ligase alpha subunit, cytoplasmic [Cinnamomum micranthum f. kanehirae]|uniref:phenylalanine--tRNA ligase n=1 Tax=Cinnamomum micranthum f. kanehirae TaxID=337451 RepID=A0A443PY78_9MAGN|nr:phenylalanine--tRNA ligase alpha subunit, cytoplasmic [Cinnamomum micranthum f. kanehirae]
MERSNATAAEDAILGFLQLKEEISNSGDFASSLGIDHDVIVNAIKSLHGFEFVVAQDIKKERWVLTDEGKSYVVAGSPEVQFFLAVPPEGISHEQLQKQVNPAVYKIGRSQATKNKWVEMGKTHVSRKVEHVEDRVKDLLQRVHDGKVIDTKDIEDLKKRKLITLQTWKGYSLKKGPKYAPKRVKAATDLTREHLQSGEWKDLEFKDYNFRALGPPMEAGHLHPLLKVREMFRRIFLEMGFEEMPTNNFVESRQLPEDYVERVKRVHESGGYGSKGYGYDWKREEADKNLLRTHTTAVSSRLLYLLAQKPFAPKRYFSIDRVFRNEAVDRTHLAEFHQIEGLVCDRGLTLGDLIGVLSDFFERLGMSKLQFKPAYNPYTEPSMEIFSYHEGFKKWVEVGNSGVFRPEMLLPMGLPEDVSVDLSLIKTNPICRLGIR